MFTLYFCIMFRRTSQHAIQLIFILDFYLFIIYLLLYFAYIKDKYSTTKYSTLTNKEFSILQYHFLGLIFGIFHNVGLSSCFHKIYFLNVGSVIFARCISVSNCEQFIVVRIRISNSWYLLIYIHLTTLRRQLGIHSGLYQRFMLVLFAPYVHLLDLCCLLLVLSLSFLLSSKSDTGAPDSVPGTPWYIAQQLFVPSTSLAFKCLGENLLF